MILGAHDCITYKQPKSLLSKLISWTAKCQDKSIEELVSLGIKCFDLRIRFDSKFNIYLCHGINSYAGDIDEILNYLNSQDGIYVRLGFENIYGDEDMPYFNAYAEKAIASYPNIKFLICKKKPEWTVLLNNFDKDFIEILTVPTWKNVLLGPKYLSKSLNVKLYKDKDVIVSGDFILNYL